jgi:hypothetical protein
MSGYSTPTPEQKSFNPPPEPVDSILGVLNFVVLPNCSATTVAKGYTVDEPTIFTTSRPAALAIVTELTVMAITRTLDNFLFI